jgi:hypothetical protein
MAILPHARRVAARLNRIDHHASTLIRALGRAIVEGLAGHALAAHGLPHLPHAETPPPIADEHDADAAETNQAAPPIA